MRRLFFLGVCLVSFVLYKAERVTVTIPGKADDLVAKEEQLDVPDDYFWFSNYIWPVQRKGDLLAVLNNISGSLIRRKQVVSKTGFDREEINTP